MFAPGPAKPRATMTFGVVAPLGPLGNPGGYEKPTGLEEGVRLVDAVVDDRDLHAVARGARQCPRTADAPMTAGPLFSDIV